MQALPVLLSKALARNLESFPGLEEVAEVALFIAAFETNGFFFWPDYEWMILCGME